MRIFTTIIAGIALVILGEMLAFYVYSRYTQGGLINGFLGISAFLAIVIGALLFIRYPVHYADIIRIKYRGKNELIKFIMGTFIFIFTPTPFILAVVAFYHFTGKYHDEQLDKFGVVKKVLIEKEIIGRNSRHDLCFSFNHEGKTWGGMLDNWVYHVGDSVEIIYSSQNPNETEWYRKYLEEIKETQR